MSDIPFEGTIDQLIGMCSNISLWSRIIDKKSVTGNHILEKQLAYFSFYDFTHLTPDIISSENLRALLKTILDVEVSFHEIKARNFELVNPETTETLSNIIRLVLNSVIREANENLEKEEKK